MNGDETTEPPPDPDHARERLEEFLKRRGLPDPPGAPAVPAENKDQPPPPSKPADPIEK